MTPHAPLFCREDGHTAALFPPRGGSEGLLCTVAAPPEAAALWEALPPVRPALVALCDVDWDRELSPWPAAKAFRGGKDFGGQADALLALLTGRLLPAAEAALDFSPRWRGIGGYSLAGLFAVYAVFHTDRFDRLASMSGSLWFDGFAGAMASWALPRPLTAAYFSLGDREKETKSPRMAAVEQCTRAAAVRFAAEGVPTMLEMNPGGHFQQVPQRTARGMGAVLPGSPAFIPQ